MEVKGIEISHTIVHAHEAAYSLWFGLRSSRLTANQVGQPSQYGLLHRLLYKEHQRGSRFAPKFPQEAG